MSVNSCLYIFMPLYICMGFPDGSVVKNPPASLRDIVSILGWERSPGEGNVNPLFSIYAWEIPRTEELGRLQSLKSQESDMINNSTATICMHVVVVVPSSVMSDSLWLHGLQHARLSCPSPSLTVYSSSWPLNQWRHPTISSSVFVFSFCLQSFPASESFPMNCLFGSGDQNIGASASVLPMNIQGWFPLKLTILISLLSKGLSGIFSSITVQKHILRRSAFFMIQLSDLYMTTGKIIALIIWTFSN